MNSFIGNHDLTLLSWNKVQNITTSACFQNKIFRIVSILRLEILVNECCFKVMLENNCVYVSSKISDILNERPDEQSWKEFMKHYIISSRIRLVSLDILCVGKLTSGGSKTWSDVLFAKIRPAFIHFQTRHFKIKFSYKTHGFYAYVFSEVRNIIDVMFLMHA